jgi:FtsZ-binding cell division protein ZapB
MRKKSMSFDNLEHLEEKVTKLVDKMKVLKEDRDKISIEVDRLRQEMQQKDHVIESLNQEKVDFLKVEEEYKRLQGERSQVQDRLGNMLKGLEEIEV